MKTKNEHKKKSTGKPLTLGKNTMPLENSGTVDAPETGKIADGFPIVGIGASAGGLSAFEDEELGSGMQEKRILAVNALKRYSYHHMITITKERSLEYL